MDEIAMLRELLSSRVGPCPDCDDERVLLPVDDDQLEWCCVDCGAAFVTWQRWTAPASPPAPSEVA
jgi:hypothetical protein